MERQGGFWIDRHLGLGVRNKAQVVNKKQGAKMTQQKEFDFDIPWILSLTSSMAWSSMKFKLICIVILKTFF